MVSELSSVASQAEIAHVLTSVSRKGVRLWVEDGALRCKAPKGALTDEDVETLKTHRAQIIASLDANACTPLSQRGHACDVVYRAPLAFSQLAYWNSQQLARRRSIKQVSTALFLRGTLDIAVLEASFVEVCRRHDALRTRIGVHGGSPCQEVLRSVRFNLGFETLEDLDGLEQKLAIQEGIEKLILEPVDLGADPLMGALVLRLRHDEHVLAVALEHIISDAASMQVLLREVLTAYAQLSAGSALALPEVSMQFPDYAIWQQNIYVRTIEEQRKYWRERLAEFPRVRFPDDSKAVAAGLPGWSSVQIRLGKELKMRLREWCRLRRTTPVMAVFTAYVALVLRWCDVPEAIVGFQSDGRVSANMEHAIGYFARRLHVRAALSGGEGFVDLIEHITAEYCEAYEHNDCSYFDAQDPPPQFTRNTLFNWVPQGASTFMGGLSSSFKLLEVMPWLFEDPWPTNLDWNNEPLMLLYDSEEETSGGVYFPLNRLSMETMERFARNFLSFLGTLLNQPNACVKDIPLIQ